MSPKETGKPDALFLAGHPVLDFLNTRMRAKGALVDVFETSEDVLHWLRRAGFPAPPLKGPSDSLLYTALELRESIRTLVERRTSGRRGDPSLLNRFLAAGPSYPQLVWKPSKPPAIDTVRVQDTPLSILAPVAEAAADLLVRDDAERIKLCEGEICVLWFLDQTKSHSRRWCSMELCGNRNKVAAYRDRRRDR